MGFNKKTIIILVAIMGLSLQWLQSQSKNSQLRFDRSERVFALDDIVPFARKAGEVIVENKNFARARKAVQNLRGRLVNQFERATLVVKNVVSSEPESTTLVAKPEDKELAKELEGKSEEEIAAILAEKAKEKEMEEQNVIGYDEEGNPIYATDEETPEGDEDAVASDETEEEGEEKPELEASNKEEDKDKSSSENHNPTTEVVYTGGPAPQETALDKENEQHACNDTLLRQPDHEAMAKCIDQYQIGQVSADAFYAVVTEMLTDNRAPIRKLAVGAVKSTPSFKSFLLLVELSKTESFNEIGDMVSSGLNEYATLRQLSVIAQVLTSNDDTVSIFARITATKILDQAANNYMKRSTASNPDGEVIPEGENGSQGGEVKTLTETQQRFQLFIAVLENYIASQPENDEALSLASSALLNIKSLLGV